MATMRIRDVELFVDVVGSGPPIVFLHGGPGLDHISLTPFKALSDTHTVVLYDHRCNGRSAGPPVETMTWDNLVADVEALRERLGYAEWAVLGHSFGGHVALEYALRHPERISGLILMDTAAAASWSLENAPKVLAGRGYGPRTVEIARRFYSGHIQPKDFARASMRLIRAYDSHFSVVGFARELLGGGWRMRTRPEALVYAGRHLLPGWNVMSRLHEIEVPTLVLAGHDDFLFPPESQALLAAGIKNARLQIIERAGHNPQAERPRETLAAVRAFLDEQVAEPRTVRRAA